MGTEIACPKCKGFEESRFRWKTLVKGKKYQCRKCGFIREVENACGLRDRRMNADVKTLNALGRDKGFGRCLYCGGRWNWKRMKTIRIDERLSMFPLCEECFEMLPIEAIEKCIRQLADEWNRFHPGDAALHREQASKAIVNARKMKEGQ